MNRSVLAAIIAIAVGAFLGQLIYKRAFEPAFSTLLKEQTKEPDYRSSVDRFLDLY